MRIWMAGRMRQFSKDASSAAVRLALPLAEFIENDVALAFNPVIIQCFGDISHPIGFHRHREVQGGGWHRCKISAVILPYESVHPGRADPFERREVRARIPLSP